MPEGPECYCFAEDLNELLRGKYLISLFYDNTFKHVKDIDQLNVINKLKKVTSKGKKIIFHFQKGYLIISLGLEGSFYLSDHKPNTLVRTEWGEEILSDSEGSDELNILSTDIVSYQDTRHFGHFEYFATKKEMEARLSEIGIDLIRDPPTFEEWMKVMGRPRKTTTLCIFLLNQKYFASIGNFLRADIMYDARIDPFRNIGSLNKNDHKRLFESTMKIIIKATEEGGASLRTYKDIKGRKGQYETLAYGKTEDAYGNKIVGKKDSQGRTMWYCPDLQK